MLKLLTDDSYSLNLFIFDCITLCMLAGFCSIVDEDSIFLCCDAGSVGIRF